MLEKEILEKLSYGCGCPLDIKEKIGVINGICPKHGKPLLVEGIPIKEYQEKVKNGRRNET